jgi:polyisoprenoid-binding protein YceI
VRYVIEPSTCKVTLHVYPSGMLSSLGHNPTFAVRKVDGEVELDTVSGASGSVTLSIDTRSIELQGDFSGRDRWDIMHIMQDEILEVQAHPAITYRAPSSRTTLKSDGGSHFEASLKGDLTLHGVTRVQPVTARLLLHGDMLRASGEATIRQPDYHLGPVAVAGSLMKVRDDVKLTFDIVARK